MDLMLDQEIAQVEKVEEQISSSSECSQNSDSSFDLENNGNNKSHLKQLASDQNGDDKKKRQVWLKICQNFEQVETSIDRKSYLYWLYYQECCQRLEYQLLNSQGNYADFQKRRQSNKNSQRNKIEIQQEFRIKQRRQHLEKSLFDTQNQKFVKVEAIQDNNETNLYQQAEEANRHQALIIQQLNTQNLYLQSRINQLQQDKLQLNSKYELMVMQYHQLQQMAQQFLQPCMFQFPTFAQ